LIRSGAVPRSTVNSSNSPGWNESDRTVEGDAARTLVQPGELLELTVDRGTAPDRIKVITGNGVAETVTEGL